MDFKKLEYGIEDSSYIMAGKLLGITQLVDEFYKNMNDFSKSKK